MKKSILAILIAITITACNLTDFVNIDDINAAGKYTQTITAPLANGTLIHFEAEFYSCIDGFVYKTVDTATTINDPNGVAYACTADIYLYATLSETNDTLYTDPG